MRNTISRTLWVAACCATSSTHAAPLAGYTVDWGPHSVPLSPFLSMLIALMLGLAAYAFIRKHNRQGLVALVIASLVGVTNYNIDSIAGSAYAYTITTESGSQYVSCGAGSATSGYTTAVAQSEILIGTNLGNGVILNSVVPSYATAAAADTPQSLKSVWKNSSNVKVNTSYTECATNVLVTPGSPCMLSCPNPP